MTAGTSSSFAPDGTSTAFGKAQGEDFRDDPHDRDAPGLPVRRRPGVLRPGGGDEGQVRPRHLLLPSPGAPPRQAPAAPPRPDAARRGQCRHQQICIQGRGGTTLDCDPTVDGVQRSAPSCAAATTTLRLCTTSPPPWSVHVHAAQRPVVRPDRTDTCHDFTVGPITADHDLHRDVLPDDADCAKCDSVTLTVDTVDGSADDRGRRGRQLQRRADAHRARSDCGTGCTFIRGRRRVNDSAARATTFTYGRRAGQHLPHHQRRRGLRRLRAPRHRSTSASACETTVGCTP